MSSGARAAALALALAACGSKAREPRTHHVEISAMQYAPAELVVAVGDTVIWTNRDVVPHTVTTTAASPVAFDSQMIEGQRQWQYKVTAAGELPYVCTYHPTMRGKLTAR